MIFIVQFELHMLKVKGTMTICFVYKHEEMNRLMEKIESMRATSAMGSYSHGIVSGNQVFLSGQLGIDPDTGKLADGIENQMRYAFKNVLYILEERSLNFSNVVKTTVLLSDMSDFQKVNEIYAEQFSEPYPARTTYAVNELPLNALVEIEVIAELENEQL